MRLIRNQTNDGTCKYGLIRLDILRSFGFSIDDIKKTLSETNLIKSDIPTLDHNYPKLSLADVVEFGEPNTEEEFLVIKLKDSRAYKPINEYSKEAMIDGDFELGNDVKELADRSGHFSKFCKIAD